MMDLSAHIRSKSMVRIERDRPSARFLHGYPLSIGYPVVGGSIRTEDALVLMWPFQDFDPNGYTIIRERDIVDVRCGAHEHLWDTMIRGENLLGDLAIPEGITSCPMQEAVRSIASRFHFLIVECEASEEPIEDFYLGELMCVDNGAIRLRTLNAMARWDDEIAVIAVDEITRVQFETPYLKRFTKYIGA